MNLLHGLPGHYLCCQFSERLYLHPNCMQALTGQGETPSQLFEPTWRAGASFVALMTWLPCVHVQCTQPALAPTLLPSQPVIQEK